MFSLEKRKEWRLVARASSGPDRRPPDEGLVKFSHDMSSQQTKSGSNFNGGRARRLWGALPAREIGRARRGATGMAGEP